MIEYHNLLRDVLENGVDADDRTGTGTRSVFGRQIRFDLSKGFPAVTTKKLAWKAVVSELLWFLEGSTDERRLAELLYGKPREQLIDKTTIWTANANAQGRALGYENNDTVKQLGPVYGSQWRMWEYHMEWEAPCGEKQFDIGVIDQIIDVIVTIKNDPLSRRHMVSAWNVGAVDLMALPPCHYGFQFYVRNGKLSCLWNQRSVDVFLGLPFNIASYALLTHLIALECGLEVGELIGNLGDTHIYNNHFDQVKEQLEREPLALPTLMIDDEFSLKRGLTVGFDYRDVGLLTLDGYEHHAPIKAAMAV
ncbi:thymidylate reductase [Sinorhizobium phage phiM7]|uniref:Thymidylate synthase n=2 Tax=Emdodecavirus TaxID=1980937 RepID=S5MBT3_9CAUD|nr:thymidylate synthase [Sinorhizobium phage phiM12]YP_009601473.1 thymidylate synthase [Sinorhizobium phage phiM7]AGR48078.1 thymidylate synthase [Sinorhizobium phage phiM12]AKF12893.1 thymidylate reductase [Sinorhizobium phage phiM7]AKF13253.1 thymidylate synthase [Sinorhizobium phage phiM19]